MSRRTILVFLLVSLSLSLLTSAFYVNPVKASGPIYIKADGTIDPPTAPILTTDNVTYTLTENITSETDGIIIEKSNITLNGEGYTIQGTDAPSSKGIDLSYVDHITIRNITVKNFEDGVHIWFSSNNTMHKNEIANNSVGFKILGCSRFISIFENNITENQEGIWLDTLECDIYVTRNKITNNYCGIYIPFDYDNFIEGNIIAHNTYGVRLSWSLNNTFFHNDFLNNDQHVFFDQLQGNATWDNGYPSGGNYWSDYNGTDLYRGPYQNKTGSDGIGDTPHIIDANNTDHYPLIKPYAGPHDIGILSLNISKTIIGEGQKMYATVNILNYGDQPENFNITLKANSTLIETKITMLTNRNSTTITFTWNTTDTTKGNYTISAYAEPIHGEIDISDNLLIDGNVFVTIPGDIDCDFDVDILDLVMITAQYGKTMPPTWPLPPIDIDGDGEITILDVVICTSHYAEKYP